MSPAAEQIDLDEMDLPAEDLLLFLQILLSSFTTEGLVGQAENFDRGHQAVLTLAPGVDLEVRLGSLLVGRLWDGHDDRLVLGLGDQRGHAAFLAAFYCLAGAAWHPSKHIDIEVDVALGALHPDQLAGQSEIGGREQRLKCFLETENQAVV